MKRLIDYHSSAVLFPREERNVGEAMQWIYTMNASHQTIIRLRELDGNELLLSWTLYADDMTPKHGTFPVSKLHDL